ncbi:hypothetical protein [Streptomyces sp. 2A115]|uniref:hypothetical protein n=1 Tax=Streptomyces sp. 2A115 TaxID=3457439 RepID=UPI003FD39B7C
MYGHGAAPPPRSTATVVSLRILFAAISFLTCGMLSFVPLIRAAMLRGKWFDWVLAVLSVPAAIGCFAVIGSLPESDGRTDVALLGAILLGVFGSVYFVVVDVRHHEAQPPFPVYIPPAVPPAGYGYPQPPSPYPATPSQAPQAPMPHTPVPQTPVPQTPVPPPSQPQRPAPARIDQVRAELDELSDYLRKQEDGR